MLTTDDNLVKIMKKNVMLDSGRTPDRIGIGRTTWRFRDRGRRR